jgi:hypothetical protein
MIDFASFIPTLVVIATYTISLLAWGLGAGKLNYLSLGIQHRHLKVALVLKAAAPPVRGSHRLQAPQDSTQPPAL